MQAPTHILAGTIITEAFKRMKNRKPAFVLVAICAFLSHGLLDKFAKMTYHRPDADFNDPVWVGYHIGVLLTTILFIRLLWKDYKWGIIFAMLPDLDWVFIHGQKIVGINIAWYKTAHIHSVVHFVFDNLWPFYHLHKLPDYRYEPLTALGEILLLILLFMFLRWQQRKNALKTA
jgi:hypothetical protein